MDVAEWLRDLGLEQYAPAFRDNDIDGKVLRRLTGDDLRDLGVTSIGHRRRLLDAIATVGDRHRAVEASPAPSQSSLTASEAERRQLTVMFCDLVGSTALSGRFDPEDLRELIGVYHRCVADTVARFAGFVAKYMGDGVLIYFGYPEAHEDDAERAVRAGLAVIDAVGRLASREALNVRLGIATGLVVVGDLIGTGAAQERGVVGETPNLAARLQGLAAPDTLVIADSTRRQIGALFEIDDLGQRALAGFSEPQRAWRIVGESGVLSRFEALRSEATPLVGRDEELDLLLSRWQQAKAGKGRVVLVSGEPGIGKSRLSAALSQRIQGDPHIRLRYFCSPYHQDSALYPVRGFVRISQSAGKASRMVTSNSTVFLVDVDNTLLDNDRIQADLRRHLEREFGAACRDRYWAILEQLFADLGYRDYLGALQRYRVEHPEDIHLLSMSSYLVDYPFANRLYPGSLDVLERFREWGRTVILSDGDVVFQPRKVERSGIFEAVDGHVLIYIHKEAELADVERRYPAAHYVLVDDKPRILAAVKKAWGDRVTTILPRQGQFARAPDADSYPTADLTIERIGDLVAYDIPALLATTNKGER